jgi:hypothetical protein
MILQFYQYDTFLNISIGNAIKIIGIKLAEYKVRLHLKGVNQ